MARSEGDTWDLASSVGATATSVAASRALASRGPDPLINDPFAEPLVKAVGIDYCNRVADGAVDFGDDPRQLRPVAAGVEELRSFAHGCEDHGQRTRHTEVVVEGRGEFGGNVDAASGVGVADVRQRRGVRAEFLASALEEVLESFE